MDVLIWNFERWSYCPTIVLHYLIILTTNTISLHFIVMLSTNGWLLRCQDFDENLFFCTPPTATPQSQSIPRLYEGCPPFPRELPTHVHWCWWLCNNLKNCCYFEGVVPRTWMLQFHPWHWLWSFAAWICIVLAMRIQWWCSLQVAPLSNL